MGTEAGKEAALRLLPASPAGAAPERRGACAQGRLGAGIVCVQGAVSVGRGGCSRSRGRLAAEKAPRAKAGGAGLEA